jgi:regulation of enolase protein 1 (concanavalin A-like superfamily)
MPDRSLHEAFAGPAIDPRLHWHCEPARWAVLPTGGLRIEPDAGTDFWQKTHYGFEVDNGHYLYAAAPGDFALRTHVRFRPVHQYDQAGLMVRLSPTCWLKTSVEFEPDGPGRLGAVVTSRGYSDWSTQPFPAGPGQIWLRICRTGGDYLIEAAPDGHDWQQIRLAHLSADSRDTLATCGIYACSPKGRGFVADFSELRIDAGGMA